MMRRIVAPLAALVFVLGSSAAAPALPGQQLPAWLAWANANPALQHLGKTRNELSGGAVYYKVITASGLTFYFSAEPGTAGASPTLISRESSAVQNVPPSYELRRHRATAAAMARVVYGPTIAADVLAAEPAGDFAIYDNPWRMTFAKGKRYAYELSGSALVVFPLSGLAEAIKNAKYCATHQCGD